MAEYIVIRIQSRAAQSLRIPLARLDLAARVIATAERRYGRDNVTWDIELDKFAPMTEAENRESFGK